MKINNVSNIDFRAGISSEYRRFVSSDMQKDIQKLLYDMNQGTVYKENSTHTSWNSDILTSVSINERNTFLDKRFLCKPVSEPKFSGCDCSLKMGGTKLDINSSTGEVVNYEKSFFKTWSSVMKQAKYYLKAFVENFNNSEVVKKNVLSIEGFTEKGFMEVQKAMYKLK